MIDSVATVIEDQLQILTVANGYANWLSCFSICLHES